MKYNFDRVINRENTNCFKYDMRDKIFGDEDVMPMWVADMDLPAPDFVIEAMRERLEHPVFGYTYKPDSYYQAMINWYKRRHELVIERDWIIDYDGVVPSLNLIIHALTNEGDGVLIQPPVYFPFSRSILNNKRKEVVNPLLFVNGRHEIDLVDFERKIKNEKVKLFILCSPHNPGGRVWTREELLGMCRICVENDVVIVSDEIHSDLVFRDFKHIPTFNLGEKIAEQTVTTLSASKTFNIAGLSMSTIVTRNKKIRHKLSRTHKAWHSGTGNIFGDIATEAAYSDGDEWLAALMDYLEGNLDYLMDFAEKELPGIHFVRPEATFLVWIDFRNLNLGDKELVKLMVEQAKLGFNDGPMFGKGGSGFQRMNIACPRTNIETALKRIKSAVDSI